MCKEKDSGLIIERYESNGGNRSNIQQQIMISSIVYLFSFHTPHLQLFTMQKQNSQHQRQQELFQCQFSNDESHQDQRYPEEINQNNSSQDQKRQNSKKKKTTKHTTLNLEFKAEEEIPLQPQNFISGDIQSIDCSVKLSQDDMFENINNEGRQQMQSQSHGSKLSEQNFGQYQPYNGENISSQPKKSDQDIPETLSAQQYASQIFQISKKSRCCHSIRYIVRTAVKYLPKYSDSQQFSEKLTEQCDKLMQWARVDKNNKFQLKHLIRFLEDRSEYGKNNRKKLAMILNNQLLNQFMMEDTQIVPHNRLKTLINGKVFRHRCRTSQLCKKNAYI